ncbi:lysoplasmalogenase family protein [Pontivivens ytuae]|uniref:YhhN-like protein n=1 Tax=Pontivivens ytuae TaxID=2789856 RepID=A0A7S9LSW9_9RHOB|nr:lysoplasmalogenase family protein [Pontivivens ytuae]QPH54689.1 hypothetical protein I0K15_02595 [Pontivivens ytuae]
MLSYPAAAISLVAALAYLFHYRVQPPSERRTAIKAAAIGALAIVGLFKGAPILFILALIVAAASDAVLALERGQSLRQAMVLALISQLLLLGTFVLHWQGIAAPIVAVLGLAGIGVGYLMLLWDGLEGYRRILCLYVAVLIGTTFTALGMGETERLAVAGMLLYLMAQVLLGLEYFLLQGHDFELSLTGPAIWMSYYGSMLLFVLAFTTIVS